MQLNLLSGFLLQVHMLRDTTSLLCTLLIAGACLAQNGNWCGTDQHLQQMFNADPEFENKFEENRIMLRELIANNTNNNRTSTVHTIPVVVHVIHQDGSENITKWQIDDGIKLLNEDFRRINADTTDTRAIFKPFAVDSEFEFRLAQKDPNGNCTSGIVRINSPLTIDADNAVKSLSYWPSNKYFNVWLVRTIEGGGNNSIILGYAQFPGGSWNTYGIVVRSDRWGRVGTSNGDGRTGSHEVGHCLGLFHTFQSGCGGNCSNTGDDLCDTPPVAQSTQGCNQSLNTCSNDQSGPSPYTADVVNQIENYMSYDDCQNMFSADQKSRMKAVVSFYNNLTNLTSSSNLQVTGTDGNDVLCAADFISDYTLVCVGEPIQFFDESYHGQNSWQWSFPGAYPSISSDQHPVTTYWSPGVYDVSLTVGNGQDNESVTKPGYVVMPMPGKIMPFSESFENTQVPGTDWAVYDPDNNNTWEHQTQAAYTGSYSVRMDNIGVQAGFEDELIGTTFDLSNYSSANVTFKVAFAMRFAGNTDKLSVYASSNCGKTWALRWAQSAATLATVSGFIGTPFTPSSQNDWVEKSVALNGSFLGENLRLKFVFESGQGNNFYMDDINIDGVFNPVPMLVSPANSAGAQANNVMLDWKAVGFVDTYEYRLDTVFGFNSPVLVTGSHSYIDNSHNNTDTEFQTSNLINGQQYYWTVRTIDGTDTSAWAFPWSFTVSQSGVSIPELLSTRVDGFAIYPNPLTENTVIAFNTASVQYVTVVIYDMLGKVAAMVHDGQLAAGEHRLSLDGSDFSSGIYVVRLIANGDILTGKMAVE